MAAFIVTEEEVERVLQRERLFRDRVLPLEAYSEEELEKKVQVFASRDHVHHGTGRRGGKSCHSKESCPTSCR